jgi:hypothetical protein
MERVKEENKNRAAISRTAQDWLLSCVDTLGDDAAVDAAHVAWW